MPVTPTSPALWIALLVSGASLAAGLWLRHSMPGRVWIGVVLCAISPLGHSYLGARGVINYCVLFALYCILYSYGTPLRVIVAVSAALSMLLMILCLRQAAARGPTKDHPPS